MGKKISIIIPVYNVSKYIEKCLKSVLKQTMSEIEVIIINDGSTDNSEEIIQEYANQDKRIIYISQKNKGVGEARNKGVEIAKGEYIGFVDPDDCIHNRMYEILYSKAKQYDADIAICDNKIVNSDIDTKIDDLPITERDINVNIEKNVKNNMADFIIRYYYREGKYKNHVWDKIFKRDVIKKNNIKFGDLKEITGEDTLFAITALAFANNIIYVHNKLYYYYIRKNSIMNTFNIDKMKKTINFMKQVENFQEKSKLYNKFELFLSGYLYNLCVASSRELIQYKKRNLLKKNIEEMLKEKIIIKYANILLEKKIYLKFTKIKQIYIKIIAKLIIQRKSKQLYNFLIIKYYLK